MKINNPFLFPGIFLAITACTNLNCTGQVNNNLKKHALKQFEVTVSTSNTAMSYSLQYILTNTHLKLIYKNGVAGGKDSILLLKTLAKTDTLQKISEMDIAKLKSYYSNDCISDGSQVQFNFKKDGIKKSVHLSNYYHEDMGMIIYLINSSVQKKYKISYNKEKLIADYKLCKTD